MADYLEILESYHDEMKATLGESIAKGGVRTEPVRTADGEVLPFGRAVHDAYVHMLMKGDELGFDTYNASNYGGHIEFKAAEPADGGRPETFGISAHLDVVPEGSGWSGDPFQMVEKDGFLYGRGVSDDKGPLVACLYAMKAIKEAGCVPRKNIRLILGLDEETEKYGMEYYLSKQGHPDVGITPDADFPLINGEMGILFFDLAQRLTKPSIKEGLRLTKLEAGTAPNAVPRIAKAVIAGDSELYELLKNRINQYCLETGYELKGKKQGSSYVIESYGRAAHGAHPHLGLNAISIMIDFLGRLVFENDELNEFFAFYNEHIGFDLHGERLGCDIEDEPSGKLILNVGMASFTEDLAQLTINIRYPVTKTDAEVFAGIEACLENSRIGIVKNLHEAPVFMDMDSPLVQQLIEAYRSETGNKEAEPFVIPGGTYAKVINNTLAFGGMFPGELNTMHQADERLSLESFFKMARIYAKAIYSICVE